MTKILKIAGTNIELEIEYCDKPYDAKGLECPCFYDGNAYEYAARCQLTGQDGDRCDSTGFHKDAVRILSGCPLPEKVVK